MKTYVKPTVYVEKLGLSHSITTACTVKITGPITGATYDDDDWPADIIFGAGPDGASIDGCNVEMDDPDVKDFCLNAPIDATMIFQS